MKISPEQMNAFREGADHLFVLKLAAHLRENYGDNIVRLSEGEFPLVQLGDETLLPFVNSGITRGRSHGLSHESSLAAFVAIQLEATPDFDEDPQIQPLLKDEGVPQSSRIDLVIAKTATQTEKVKHTLATFPDAEPRPVARCPLRKVVAQPAPTPPTPKPEPAPTKKEEPKPEKKTFIEITLVDLDGKPVPAERYRVTLPNGEVKEGTLNSYGQAGFYEIDPGTCKITFPDLDRDTWEPA